MSRSVVLAGLSPHPPIIVPEVGKGEEKEASATYEAENELARQFVKAEYDTLVVITPHGPAFSDALSVSDEEVLSGDLADFGAPGVRVTCQNDLDLLEAISARTRVPLVKLNERNYWRYGIKKDLDHGTMVPLSFFKKQGFNRKILVINIGFLSYLDLYAFGKDIGEAAARLNRRIAVLASGDLSHRLIPGAPAGYNEKGKVFDEKLVRALSEWNVEEILFFPPDLVEEAGECGLRPITIMLGTLDEARVSPKVLSYEGPFGVGYCIGVFQPVGWDKSFSRVEKLLTRREKGIEEIRKRESFPVRLARTTVEEFITTGKFSIPEDVPSEFRGRAGVFVSIHKEGNLRGCIGTIEPERNSIAEEIVYNAISAATQDPRFAPIRQEELPYLDYSVDVLSEPETVVDISNLDPKKYGVIVEKGFRRGLLLPDLPGVNTVEEQLSIARRKAGIAPSEKGVTVKAFTVTRYH